MIDERSLDGTGWARFSDDRRYRYRLARALTQLGHSWLAETHAYGQSILAPKRIVFVMLNPSTADAFKVDPTVARCVKFARRWGGDMLEVVNLFALRSPDPAVLKAAGALPIAGAGVENDEAIVEACRHATRVIAAWGRGGELWMRARDVEGMLFVAGVDLEALGVTEDGVPKHPLARGKHRIPDDVEPRRWP